MISTLTLGASGSKCVSIKYANISSVILKFDNKIEFMALLTVDFLPFLT